MSAPKQGSRNGRSKLVVDKISEAGYSIKPVIQKRRTTEVSNVFDNFTTEFDVRKMS